MYARLYITTSEVYGTLEQPCQWIPLARWLQQSSVQQWLTAMLFWLKYPRPTSTNCSVSRILWPELSWELVVVTTSHQSSQIYTSYQSMQGKIYKIAMLVFKIHEEKQPMYLAELKIYIGYCGRFGRGTCLYRHRSQLFGRLWIRLPLPTRQFSEI